jgi:hypothetical protein
LYGGWTYFHAAPRVHGWHSGWPGRIVYFIDDNFPFSALNYEDSEVAAYPNLNSL